MESYITNRKQYGEINETNSDTLTLITGLPQGCIIGTLLFIICINNIAQASELLDFIICANDTTLSTTIEIIFHSIKYLNVVSRLNAELANISDRLKANKLSLSVQKCKYMIFHTIRKQVHPLQLIIDDTILERVHEFDFLELTLNEHLNWNTHINKISNKVSKSMGILIKTETFSSTKK